jgi:hypothetical protein
MNKKENHMRKLFSKSGTEEPEQKAGRGSERGDQFNIMNPKEGCGKKSDKGSHDRSMKE